MTEKRAGTPAGAGPSCQSANQILAVSFFAISNISSGA